MMTTQSHLIDVSHLSQALCSRPILVELKYATADNVTGVPADGYEEAIKHVGLLTPNVARHLCQVQEYLMINYGCILMLYDAYRPLRAVNALIQWGEHREATATDFAQKQRYYPNLTKHDLFEQGYFARTADSPCYGNTVDVVLADMDTGLPLDMGSAVYFMDPHSRADVLMRDLSTDAKRLRYILGAAMKRFGFIASERVYWHYEFNVREVATPLDVPIRLD